MSKIRQTGCTVIARLLLTLDMQTEHTQWVSLSTGTWLMLYPREREEGQRKSLCTRHVVHVNSMEDKRLRTILDFELFSTLKQPCTCP